MKKSSNHNFTKHGFSLAEVLVVVAIIVVLAAISIPIFTSQLKGSRRQTDIDNYNAACHSAIAAYFAKPSNARIGTITYAFDASTGMVHEYSNGEFIVPEGYGCSTSSDWDGIEYNMGSNYPCNNDGFCGFVVIQFNNGDMTAWWTTGPDIPYTEATPSTSGAPIVQLDLME